MVHLLAITGRLGIDLTLDDFNGIGSRVPLLVDLQPADRFLMDDLYRAGGCSQSCGTSAISSTRRPSRSLAVPSLTTWTPLQSGTPR